MSIDLGDSPVGTPPTEGQKTQIKEALGISAEANAFLDSFPNPEISGLQFTNPGQILRDYQYGSFTPIFHINGTTEQSTYAIQDGYYVKIGRLVSVNIFIKITNFDTAFKTAPYPTEFGIKGLPHSARIDDGAPDTMIVSVNPKKGWIQLGANSYNGSVGSSPDGLIYFEKNTPQGATPAGEAWNYARIKVGDFNVHPFNFTSDGFKAFTFQISGTYITDDDI